MHRAFGQHYRVVEYCDPSLWLIDYVSRSIGMVSRTVIYGLAYPVSKNVVIDEIT